MQRFISGLYSIPLVIFFFVENRLLWTSLEVHKTKISHAAWRSKKKKKHYKKIDF